MANWKLKVGMLFDSKEFEAGVQRIDKQLKILDSELKLSQSSIKNFGNTSDQLKAKASSLTEKIELQKAKVEGLRKAYNEAVATKGEDATATQNLEIKLNNASTALNKMQLELKQVKEELKNQPSLLDKMGKQVDSLNEKLGGVGSSLESFGKKLSAGVITPLVGLMTSTAKTSLSFVKLKEDTRLAFQVLLGGADEAQKMLDDLYTFAKTTPFSYAQYLTAGKNLTAMGVAAKDVIPYLEGITNASIATSSGTAGIESLSDAIGRMSSKGKMSLEELNKFLERGVPAVKILGNAFGKTEEQIYDMLSSGDMVTSKYLPALIKGMNEGTKGINGQTAAYGGLAKEMKNTLSGALDTLNSRFRNMSIEMWNAENAYPALIKVIRSFTDTLNVLPKLFGVVGDVATPTLENISKALDKFNKVIENTDSEQLAQIGKMILGLAATGPALIGIGKLTQGLSSFNTKMTEINGKIPGAISSIQNFASNMGNGIATGFGKATTSLSNFIHKIPFVDSLENTISTKIGAITSKVGNLFKPLTTKIGTAMQPVLQKVQSAFGKIGTIATQSASKLQNITSFAIKLIGPAAIVGLLIAGLGVAQSQFGEQLDQFLNIAIEKGPILISEFTTRVVAELPKIMDLGVQLLMTLVDVIIANLPSVLESAVQIVTTLASGVATNADLLISKIIDLILMLVNTIVDNLPLILETGLKLLLALTQGIVNNIDKILDGILNVLLKLIDFIADNLPMIIDMGIKIIIALAQGLVKAIPKIIDSIGTIVSHIFDAFKKIKWGDIGKSIIDGLVAGLNAAKDLVVNAMKSIAKGAIGAFKKFFGINSPSKVYQGFGKNIDEGLAIGLDDNLDFVEDSMDNLMNTMNFVPDGLDYELRGLKTTRNGSVSQVNNTTKTTTNKNVNIYLNIEHFENNREEDVEELMAEMEYIAKKELIGNGGNA